MSIPITRTFEEWVDYYLRSTSSSGVFKWALCEDYCAVPDMPVTVDIKHISPIKPPQQLPPPPSEFKKWVAARQLFVTPDNPNPTPLFYGEAHARQQMMTPPPPPPLKNKTNKRRRCSRVVH